MPVIRSTKPKARKPKATQTKKRKPAKKTVKPLPSKTVCLKGYRINKKGECVVDKRSKIVVKSIPMAPPPPVVIQRPMAIPMAPSRPNPYAYLKDSNEVNFHKTNPGHYVTKRVNINGQTVELKKAANRPLIQGPMRAPPVHYGPENRPVNYWDGGNGMDSSNLNKGQIQSMLQQMVKAVGYN
jgi:hypothetical protein